MYEDPYDSPSDSSRAHIAEQIEKTAKQQHLSGKKREVFTDTISLCGSCRWAQSRRRASSNTRRMDCSVFSGPCPEDITECSEYSTITSLTLSQMADIAIIIDTGPIKRVGFHGE